MTGRNVVRDGGGQGERLVLPRHARGQRIGLFGGSFNPPHPAHRQASLLALRRLDLDQVWWLVTPGNPLKDNTALPPLEERLAAARAVSNHPRIVVTGIEAQLGTRFTVDTLRALRRLCPGVCFVWIMGADGLRDFHRWRHWRRIFALMPIAVVDRDRGGLRALASPSARAFARARLPERAARLLPRRPPPAWVFLHGLKSPLSSTALRAHESGRRVVERGGAPCLS
ncbi:MAG TPA: nicotinate-nucleotide adenylyltransferase [Xanthobacteraceae bacterium]|nr:nicotinate-nucleotide adenylyltransferase [Xanthobacteraceae bacterium]